jgi:hypothetical protein
MLKPLVKRERLHGLYNPALEAWDMYVHWKDVDNPQQALEYFIKCETLVELMEKLHVYYQGLGANLKCRSLHDRLNSFDFCKD